MLLTMFLAIDAPLSCSGFHQVTSGPDSGAFCNHIFLRDKPDIFQTMPKNIKNSASRLPHKQPPFMPASSSSTMTTYATLPHPNTVKIKLRHTMPKFDLVASIKDPDVVANALNKRDEEERLRAARAMLHANFREALRSSSG